VEESGALAKGNTRGQSVEFGNQFRDFVGHGLRKGPSIGIGIRAHWCIVAEVLAARCDGGHNCASDWRKLA
jgi:hypothetical protein